jgi:uncharacterized protein involved in exopolysaccharide biosynthesis
VTTVPPASALSPPPPPEPLAEPDLFDYEFLRNAAGFVLRGVRRHRQAALLTAGAVLLVGAVVVAVLPRTYHAEARLLANQNQLIRALGNPRASLPSEDPTRAARELIFAHDNLVSLMRQTNLMKQWEEGRPLVLKLRDGLARLVGGAAAEQDKIDAMVGTLEKHLKVETDQQTVTISIDWPDPQQAYLLVETAQQNFLETRHLTEMTAISEALSILEMHAGAVQKTVEDSLHELERVRDLRRKGVTVSPTAAAAVTEQPPLAASEPEPRPNAATEPELAQLKFLMSSKKRALADLEESRTRRLAELTSQLQEQKVQYADQHPVVLDTIQRIEAVKEDSPQMVQVKGDIEQLLAEYTRKGGRHPESLVEPTSGGGGRRAITQAGLSGSDLNLDPMVDFARNNLRVASAKYEDLMMRIDGARIEQDTARAAFKYRYSVVRPASVPKKPVRPDVALLTGAVVLLALLSGLFAGAVRDLLRGRLVEGWQVERALKLKVLSHVHPGALAALPGDEKAA